jgi:DNA-binding winged helix-turn-helix (wHTH) protein
MNNTGRIYYHFGSFCLDVEARLLIRQEEPIPLTPKLFETLLVLVQAQGKIVEREQLLQAVWQDSYIEDGNISSTIYLLRKALGDNRNSQGYIVTVPRRGYRFTAPVRETIEPQAGGMTPHAIAVLPFRSLSASENSEGLGLGLADAVITQLSNCHQLTIRPTSVVRKYVDTEINYATTGQELSVESVVECHFQLNGEYIRVTAQLIRLADIMPLWAATYDEHFTDLFAVEDVLSQKIASDLIDELTKKSLAEIPGQ